MSDLKQDTNADAPVRKTSYEAWKQEKIKSSLGKADANPDDVKSHDDVFDGIKAKFRP